MSIYTTTDRDNVKQAIIDLATGSRVVRTEVGGKTREFHPVNLDRLRALLSDIQSDLSGSGTGGSGGIFNRVQFNDPC